MKMESGSSSVGIFQKIKKKISLWQLPHSVHSSQLFNYINVSSIVTYITVMSLQQWSFFSILRLSCELNGTNSFMAYFNFKN